MLEHPEQPPWIRQWSGYPWCTWILRHRGSVTGVHPRIVGDILGMVSHGWISLDSPGILGVHGYSDTGG